MTTISAGNQTKLRQGRHKSKFYFSVLQPQTLLSARVNDVGIERGERSIVYDTGSSPDFSAITAGMPVWFGTASGLHDVGIVRLKSISGTATSGTIGIAENGVDFVDDLFIRIPRDQAWIFGIPPTIDNGVFKKDFSIEYSNQNSQPNPVAIMGPHRAGQLSSGSIVFDLDASASYAIANGASISSYSWSCTGGTIASASSATTTLTITAAGTYWLSLTVTDSNGKTQTGRRFVRVHDANDPAYRDFTISGLAGDWQSGGWSFNVQAHGDVTLSDFPDGSICILWHQGYIDGAEDYVNIWAQNDQIICVGYIRSDSDSDNLDQGHGDVNFTVTTPNGILDNLDIGASVSINAVSTPATWYEYANWLTPGRAIHHLLKWHTTVMETCDVYGLTTDTRRVKNVDFTEQSIGQMINGLAMQKGIGAKLISDRLGRLRLVKDSQLLNLTDRGNLDTVMSITTADLSQQVTITRQPEPRVALGHLDGFSFDGSASTPFISLIPGYRTGGVSFGIAKIRGTGAMKHSGQVVTNQTDANERLGRLFHTANNPWQDVRLDFRGNYLGAFDIDPSLGWYTLGWTNATLARALSTNGLKSLCRHVDVPIDVSAGTMDVSTRQEIEVIGEDAIQGNYPTGFPAAPEPDAPTWNEPVEDTFAFRTLTEIDASAWSHHSARMSDTRVLIVNDDRDTLVIEVDGSGFSIGTPVVLTTASGFGGGPDVAALEDDKAIASYTSDADDDVFARIITVSGLTPTINTEYTIRNFTTALVKSRVAAISSTRTVVVYEQNGQISGKVCDVSGTVITPNSEVSIVTGTLEESAAAGSNVVVTYVDGNALKAVLLHTIGTTFTVGTPITLTTDFASTQTNSTGLSELFDSAVLVVYRQPTAANTVVRQLTVSGTTLAAETADTLGDAGAPVGSQHVWVVGSATGGNGVVLTYKATGNTNFARRVSISGTSVLFEADEFDLGDGSAVMYHGGVLLTDSLAVAVSTTTDGVHALTVDL